MKRKHVGFLEVTCEAPSYNTVSACTWLERPLDQRWRLQPVSGARCCGLVVELHKFWFNYQGGYSELLGIGQCPVCKACHWHV